MMFTGIALLVAIALAAIISSDAGSIIGLTQEQTGRAIPLLIVLVLFASSVFAGRQKLGTIIGSFAIWIALGFMVIAGYSYRVELSQFGNRLISELQPGVARVDPASGNVRITRALGGSFRIETDVNGVTTPMIFDTGASAVVLSIEDAARAGVDTEGLDFSVPVQTANGTGFAAAVTLKSIAVGPITRSNIRAFVVEHSSLDTSLLGMTFLETLSRYSVSQNALELED